MDGEVILMILVMLYTTVSITVMIIKLTIMRVMVSIMILSV